MSNTINVRGHVGTHPEIVITQAGRRLVKFRLGSTRSFRDRVTGEWREHPTDWFTVEVWGDKGINLDRSLRVGVPVAVVGTFSCQEWTKEDRQGHTNVINADSVAIDLRHGKAEYTKITREAAPTDAADASADTPDAAASGAAEGEDVPETAPDAVDPRAWEKVESLS